MLPMFMIFPNLRLSIDLAASFERRKTALSCVSMTLSQSSDFSCNTPPLNDTLPALFTRMSKLPSSLSTLLSAGCNPVRLVISTLIEIVGRRPLSVQRALAGSFRHFVQTLRRQPRLRPTRVQCSGQSHDFRPSRQQLGRSGQIMRTFSSSSPRPSWSAPVFAALWMCFPACSFSFRLQCGANGLWSFGGHSKFANVSLPVEKRCGVRKETAQHRIFQMFIQMFLRLVTLIEEPQCWILE